jgi:hypothetical protein
VSNCVTLYQRKNPEAGGMSRWADLAAVILRERSESKDLDRFDLRPPHRLVTARWRRGHCGRVPGLASIENAGTVIAACPYKVAS